MRAIVFVFSVIASLGVAIPRAAACSCSIDPGPARLPASPWFSGTTFPSNGLFTSSLEWRDAAGVRLSLARDEALSEALGFDVRRPASAVVGGSVVFPTDDCAATGECDHRLVFADPDLTPPSAAELRDVTVILADGAPESGASCQVDSLVIDVVGSDDVTPLDELTTVVFLGATADEAATIETFAFGLAYDVSGASDTQATIVLGGAEGHRRAGGRLPESGAFCFSVALMDWAGNVGPRSDARCVDTKSAADPATQLVPYDPPCSGAFCAVGRGGPAWGGGVWLLALIGFVIRTRRGAQKKQRPSPR